MLLRWDCAQSFEDTKTHMWKNIYILPFYKGLVNLKIVLAQFGLKKISLLPNDIKKYENKTNDPLCLFMYVYKLFQIIYISDKLLVYIRQIACVYKQWIGCQEVLVKILSLIMPLFISPRPLQNGSTEKKKSLLALLKQEICLN